MTKEELAFELVGLNYGDDIPRNLLDKAKENGLVIVTGYSDDNMEFAGALDNEYGCYGGGDIFFTKDSTEVTEEDFDTISEMEDRLGIKIPLPVNKITACFCKGDSDWSYETEIPHATFHIYEDDNLYCVGIVFSINDLK